MSPAKAMRNIVTGAMPGEDTAGMENPTDEALTEGDLTKAGILMQENQDVAAAMRMEKKK